jgi:deazaflavin-dependent oxidoreductase (nitroreductase family)
VLGICVRSDIDPAPWRGHWVYGLAMHRLVATLTHHGARLRHVGPLFGRAHAWLVRRTGGRLGGAWLGAPVLTLVTVGRRTGKVRETALLYVTVGEGDGGGGLAVLGANAGNDKPPAWWHNLVSAPTADVVVRGKRMTMRWREATGAEHATLLAAFVKAYPPAGHYASYTDRVLPIAVLTPESASS